MLKHILHRFGIPETITVDLGTMFNGDLVKGFADE